MNDDVELDNKSTHNSSQPTTPFQRETLNVGNAIVDVLKAVVYSGFVFPTSKYPLSR